MNDRQKRFCEFYAENPDGTDAAIKAGYSTRTAASIASENLRKPELLQYIRKLQTEAAEIRVASVTEAKAVWSDILRDPVQKAADRIRAGELLARAAGAFIHFRDDDTPIMAGEINGEDVIIYMPEIADPAGLEVSDPDPDEESEGST